MIRKMLAALPDAAEVTERPERLWQVERMSKHIYRAWLSDGGVALATVMEDGSLSVRELEAVL